MIMLQKISSRIVDIVSFAILLLLFVMSLVETCTMVSDYYETTIYNRDSLAWNIVVIIIFLGVVRLLDSFIHVGNKWKWLYIAVSLVYCIVAAYSVYSIRYGGYDQLSCVAAAESLLNGDYSMWAFGGYCYIWPNQNGLVLYFALLFKLFGCQNYSAIYTMNIVFYYASTGLVRKIVAYYIDKKGVLFAVWAIMLLYYPIIVYTGFAYGTIPGFFFAVLTVYFYFLYEKSNRVVLRCVYALAGGGALTASICLKSNYMIMAVALLLVCLIRAVSEKTVVQAAALIVFSLAFAAGAKLPGLYFVNLTGNPTDEGVPAIAWVEMGLQTNENYTDGWYNGYSFDTYKSAGANHDAAADLVRADLKDTLQGYEADLSSALTFLHHKVASQWNNPDFYAHRILSYRTADEKILRLFVDDDSRFYSEYIWILDKIMLLVYFGSLCYLVFQWKNPDILARTGYIAFVGGFLFHIIWEGKSQYALPYFVLLMPSATIGVWKLTEQMNSWSSLVAHFRTAFKVHSETRMEGGVSNMNELDENIIRKEIRVYGWVQGVGFRYRTTYAAEALGATGWVRNEPDGSVLMEIQGTQRQIDGVFRSVSTGRYVNIEKMDARTIPVVEGEYGFRPIY